MGRRTGGGRTPNLLLVQRGVVQQPLLLVAHLKLVLPVLHVMHRVIVLRLLCQADLTTGEA
jgi:hypothetical protein